MVEWRVNLRFEDRLFPRCQGTDYLRLKHGDGAELIRPLRKSLSLYLALTLRGGMFSVDCSMAFREKTRARQTGKWSSPVS
jgi:hypothetical protein